MSPGSGGACAPCLSCGGWGRRWTLSLRVRFVAVVGKEQGRRRLVVVFFFLAAAGAGFHQLADVCFRFSVLV